MWYYPDFWRRKNKLKSNLFLIFRSSFPTFENIVMVTYTLFFTIFFSMNYTGHFCLNLPSVLLGKAWAATPGRSKPGAARKCSVQGGLFYPDGQQEDLSVARCVFWHSSSSYHRCLCGRGIWGSIAHKAPVAEQNPIPLNQAALMSQIWIVCSRCWGEALQRKAWKQVIVMLRWV